MNLHLQWLAYAMCISSSSHITMYKVPVIMQPHQPIIIPRLRSCDVIVLEPMRARSEAKVRDVITITAWQPVDGKDAPAFPPPASLTHSLTHHQLFSLTPVVATLTLPHSFTHSYYDFIFHCLFTTFTPVSAQ